MKDLVSPRLSCPVLRIPETVEHTGRFSFVIPLILGSTYVMNIRVFSWTTYPALHWKNAIEHLWRKLIPGYENFGCQYGLHQRPQSSHPIGIQLSEELPVSTTANEEHTQALQLHSRYHMSPVQLVSWEKRPQRAEKLYSCAQYIFRPKKPNTPYALPALWLTNFPTGCNHGRCRCITNLAECKVPINAHLDEKMLIRIRTFVTVTISPFAGWQ